MHLDAGDVLAKRRGLEVEQAEPGHAHQHQLVAQQCRCFSRQDLLGRYEPLRVVRTEVKIKRAIGLQRHRELADVEREALAALVGESQERSAGGDAQHVDRKRGHDHLPDARHQWHAPHDAFGVRADQPSTGRSAIDLGTALQMAVEAPQAELALAGDLRRHGLRREGIAPIAVLEAGDAHHHPLTLECLREHGIGTSGGPVRLHEQQIDAHRCRARGADGADQLRHQRARPGPLAARVERALVDRDDHRGRSGAVARHQPLVAVEQRVAQRAGRRRLERKQEAQRREQSDTDRARSGAEFQRSISMPSCAAETRSG